MTSAFVQLRCNWAFHALLAFSVGPFIREKNSMLNQAGNFLRRGQSQENPTLRAEEKEKNQISVPLGSKPDP